MSSPEAPEPEAGENPTTGPTLMKVVRHESYGPMEVLRIQEVAKPTPQADEVLVRVRAAGLHVGDCFGVRGSPFLMRMMTGLFRPKRGIPGYDVAGTVEATGPDVTRFGPGDEVFGVCDGACAEYVCAAQDKLAHKPAGLDMIRAAALPTSGLAALHALRDVGKVQAGQKALINGASGGVGTFAVQIAHALGAQVTAVCGPDNVELVQSLGADRVIDYTHEDFTRGEDRYDLVFDNIENRSLSECRRILTPKGTLILNSGTGARGLGLLVRIFKPLLLSPFVRHKLRRYLSVPNREDLIVLTGYIQEGKLEPVLDRTWPLEETAAALAHIETGHARGKVVVTL